MTDATPTRPGDSADPTRQKLLDAAGEIFAEQGFQAATVREICARAGANVAAVNYHFGDKTGLYIEVMKQSTCAARDVVTKAGVANASPEEVLQALIHGMLRNMIRRERPSWAFRLMAHEIARPTPALRQVIEEVIRPNYGFLRSVLGAMLDLPPDHATTRMCAHSIIGQVSHYVHARPVIGELWPDLQMTDEQVEMLADHIADFSIIAVKELARRTRTDVDANS